MADPTIAKVLLGLVSDVAERLREAHLAGHLEQADLQEASAAFVKALEGDGAANQEPGSGAGANLNPFAIKQQNGVEASTPTPDKPDDDRKSAPTPTPPPKEPESQASPSSADTSKSTSSRKSGPSPSKLQLADSQGSELAASSGRSVSGIGTLQSCVDSYMKMKKEKAYGFVVFKIKETVVEVESMAPPSFNYEDLEDSLPDGEPRYVTLDCKYVNSDGCQLGKLVFILWSPDCAPMRMKMLYASTKDHFKGCLDGISLELQASDASDIEESSINEKVKSSFTRK